MAGPPDERELLACCTVCVWTGLYRFRPVVAPPYANWPAAAVNVCPVCGQGEVRCAVGAGEQRQAIAEHLATRVEGADVSLTSDGKTVVVLRQGRRPPQVVIVDPTAIAADPRAALDDLLVRLGGPAGPGTPYR